jgi:hypothetical protein
MESPPNEPRPIRTLRQQFWDGLKNAQRRRPMSFYLLVSIPVVLLLAVHLLRSLEDPRRFVFGLSVLFIFLGVVLMGAFLDMFSIIRRGLAERNRSYKETLGDDEFLEELRANRASGED